MIKRVVIALLLFVPVCMGQEKGKLYIHIEYKEHGDRVIFIQDLETGTRCYAITNDMVNTTGYAISCVPSK